MGKRKNEERKSKHILAANKVSQEPEPIIKKKKNSKKEKKRKDLKTKSTSLELKNKSSPPENMAEYVTIESSDDNEEPILTAEAAEKQLKSLLHITPPPQNTSSSAAATIIDLEEEPDISTYSNYEEIEEMLEDEQEIESEHRMKTLSLGIMYRKHDSDSIFVSIATGLSLYIWGRCKIKVQTGSVEVYGYTITSDTPEMDLYSPRGHSLLCITATSEIEDTSCILKGFDNDFCQGIRYTCPDGESLIGSEFIGMGSGKVPVIKDFMIKLGFKLIPPNLLEKNRLLETGDEWETVFNTFECSTVENGRLGIFGGKGVGKSTFTRWLVNKILHSSNSSLLYIDLDPGQAEFTPPGLVSLILCEKPILGPNFTHLSQPLMSVFIGKVNVADAAQNYVQAMRQMYEYIEANEVLSTLPWIINTMGFSQGLGVSFACEAIKIFQPKVLVQIHIDHAKRSYPFDLTIDNVKGFRTAFGKRIANQNSLTEYTFLKIASVCNKKDEENLNKNQWGKSASQLRENVLVSYFASQIGGTPDKSLLSVIPYIVNLEEIAIGTMNSRLDYEEILRAINGNLIAFCKLPKESFESFSTPQGLRQLLTKAENFSNLFYGFGICRSMSNNSLQVITPVDHDILKTNVNIVICAGEIGLPKCFYHSESREQVKKATNIIGSSSFSSSNVLHSATRREYIPNKKITHTSLKNCLL